MYRLEVFSKNIFDMYAGFLYVPNFFSGFYFCARPTHDDGRPPTMPLSSTVTAMKTKAAAILSCGLAAAFIFMLSRVLCLRKARWRRITPASTDNAVEAGNDTTHGGVVNAASSPFCAREGRRPPSPVEGRGDDDP